MIEAGEILAEKIGRLILIPLRQIVENSTCYPMDCLLRKHG
jgi:hypothetical protein